MHFVHALGGFTFVLRHLQRVFHMYPSYHQHCPIFFDFPGNFARQIVGAHGDLARSQRAGKSARESASGRRNDIVDCRRVRLRLAHINAIVLGDRAVDTKQDRLAFGRKCGRSERTAESANMHLGFVNDV